MTWPRKERVIGVRLTKEEAAGLAAAADRLQLSTSAAARHLLRKALEREEANLRRKKRRKG